jgi:hypothetical protein
MGIDSRLINHPQKELRQKNTLIDQKKIRIYCFIITFLKIIIQTPIRFARACYEVFAIRFIRALEVHLKITILASNLLLRVGRFRKRQSIINLTL